MTTINTFGASDQSNALQSAFLIPDIKPGDDPSYEACKTVMLYHPLGYKLTETPIQLAQSQQRIITVSNGPEDRLREEFDRVWKRMKMTRVIRNTMKLARAYGISTLVMGAVGTDSQEPVDWQTIHKQEIFFNVLDPLNTSGSLVLNQDPNAPDFMKKRTSIRANGVTYHPSRTIIMMNEDPVYISYTTSAYGFVGRSVFQRAWYPLKSFVQTMYTDDLISRKAGVLVAKMKPAGSAVSQFMTSLANYKRQMAQQAKTDNILGITTDESIESLNLMNLDGAAKFARDNILKNIAAASDMPAAWLDQETFARGMAEGAEDAKAVAQKIDTIRDDMEPLYDFADEIVQRMAWNPDFYITIQHDFPEYKNIPYDRAFSDWQRSFSARWPSFLVETPREQIEQEDIKQKAIMAAMQIAMPVLDPENRANLMIWAQDNMNENKKMFTTDLNLDPAGIIEYSQNDHALEHVEPEMPVAAKPMSALS